LLIQKAPDGDEPVQVQPHYDIVGEWKGGEMGEKYEMLSWQEVNQYNREVRYVSASTIYSHHSRRNGSQGPMSWGASDA